MMASHSKSQAHPSDSSAQRSAEDALISLLSTKLGFSVLSASLTLESGCSVKVDGINREHRFLCEVYCRIGKLKPAQLHKVASDILKLSMLERALGGSWRKAICFADEDAASALRNRSWLAVAAKEVNVEVVVLALPAAARAAVLSAQECQFMTNKVTSDD